MSMPLFQPTTQTDVSASRNMRTTKMTPEQIEARFAALNARRAKPPAKPAQAKPRVPDAAEVRERAERKRREAEQLASCRADVERLRAEGLL